MEAVSPTPKILPSHLGFGKILKALGQTSSTTLAVVLVSVITNKILSVVGGVSAVGTMGIYRNFGALIFGLLAFGYSTVIMQQVSVAGSREELAKVLRASGVLIIFQCIAGAVLIAFLSYPVAVWLIGSNPSSASVRDIAIVVVMALINIWLNTLISIFRGLSKLWVLTAIQFATALSSLALIYPLVKTGTLGLAVNVGSGGVFGIIIGLYFMSKECPLSQVIGDWREGAAILRKSARSSGFVMLVGGVVLGAILSVQSVVNRTYGIEALGNFNAAYLIMETGIMVLMSSAYSYFLPGFAKCQNEEEKTESVNRMLTVLLGLAAGGAVFLAVCSKWIILLLFSKEFNTAAKLLSICGVGLVGLVYTWVYNTVLLHKANYRDYFVVELIAALFLVTIALVGAHFNQPLTTIAWAYAISCTLKGLFYAIATKTLYGARYVRWPNAFLAIGILTVLTIAQLFA